jgi:fermentation-respiration switch protein FrsA (DUF1100 family)
MLAGTMRILLALAALYAGFALLAYGLAERVIFQPHQASYRDTAEIRKITTRNGKRISALYLAAPAARFTLLVSHGNAEDLGDDQPWYDDLRAAGFNVLAYDYEGYGTSEGTPSEAAAYRDEQAAYDYLTGTLHLPPSQIVVYGRSVGTGPAVELASREPVGGLILQSPFLSAFRVLTHWPILPLDRFPSYRRIGRVKCPVLIMHGRQDEVIPFYHGARLFELARDPKRNLWVNAHHNDFNMVARTEYLAAVREFAASLGGK